MELDLILQQEEPLRGVRIDAFRAKPQFRTVDANPTFDFRRPHFRTADLGVTPPERSRPLRLLDPLVKLLDEQRPVETFAFALQLVVLAQKTWSSS